MKFTDEDIITGLRERDGKVISFIERRFFSMIEHIVTSKGGQKEEARDLFNEAMIAIIMKIDSPSFELTCQFKSYLYAVCNNMYKLILKRRRIAGKFNSIPQNDQSFADFSEDYDRKLYKQKLLECFHKLGPKCQKIYKMYWNEISQKDIAKDLGVSYAYLRKRKHECRKRLIEIIKSDPAILNLVKDEIPTFLE